MQQRGQAGVDAGDDEDDEGGVDGMDDGACLVARIIQVCSAIERYRLKDKCHRIVTDGHSE